MKANCIADHKTQMELLFSVATIIGKRSGQRQMLQDVLDLLEAELAMYRGTIMLLSPDGGELVVEATRTISDVQPNQIRYRYGEGVTGRVLKTGEPAVVPRVAEEPRFRDRIHRRGGLSDQGLSFVCVPISDDHHVAGTLAVDLYADGEALLDEAKRVLSIIATMIANDVHARRVAQQQNKLLEEENLRLRTALGTDYQGGNGSPSLTLSVNNLERKMITEAINACHGNVSAASRRLGITPRMTRYKMLKLGIKCPANGETVGI